MAIFTGGGPLSEPVRTVYREIRRTFPEDPAIMATVDFIANRPAAGTATPTSSLEVLKIQANHLRITFNRKQFMECNLGFFEMDQLIDAAKQYHEAKHLLEINPDDRYSNTTLMHIFNSLHLHLESQRFVPFLPLSLCSGKDGPNPDSSSHFWGSLCSWLQPISCSGGAFLSQPVSVFASPTTSLTYHSAH